ncbi:MAG TPA: hypothetical protein IAD23_03100 [Candidatus Scubalenecus merdavium]|uniref:Uncharacterized protein n=1 Tax=Candidatus Scybalenecus merdavium TaxID=2840939 RepID=A0A9D1SNV2_9FIRM|nr:hypothetical protein [Candidatus Scubalenecus merdavium]
MKNDGTKQTSLLESKALCVSLLLMALVFNVIFGCLRNPLGEDNTISWIGYDHPFGFIVWGTLTAAAFYVSISRIYRRYNYSGKLGTAALHIAPFMAATFVFINDWGWEHVIHWIGAIGFIALNGAALLLFFLHNFKKHISYKITTFAVAAMLLAMLVILLTIGKSGLLELVPIWISMILLILINTTDIYPVVNEPAPAKLEVKDLKKAEKLAWGLGIFGAHEFYQNNYPQAIGHFLTTYIGVLIFLERFIGMGVHNNLSGEYAWTYIATGLAIVLGSVAWAFCDASDLRRAQKTNRVTKEKKETTAL